MLPDGAQLELLELFSGTVRRVGSRLLIAGCMRGAALAQPCTYGRNSRSSVGNISARPLFAWLRHAATFKRGVCCNSPVVKGRYKGTQIRVVDSHCYTCSWASAGGRCRAAAAAVCARLLPRGVVLARALHAALCRARLGHAGRQPARAGAHQTLKPQQRLQERTHAGWCCHECIPLFCAARGWVIPAMSLCGEAFWTCFLQCATWQGGNAWPCPHLPS